MRGVPPTFLVVALALLTACFGRPMEELSLRSERDLEGNSGTPNSYFWRPSQRISVVFGISMFMLEEC
jgi:hypothetical protein